MSYQIIPITISQNQSMTISLDIDSTTLTLDLAFHFNDIADYWVMSITDSITRDIIVDSIPLLTGDYPAADILSPYKHLAIGSLILLNATNISEDHPTLDTLGSDWLLIWGDTNPS